MRCHIAMLMICCDHCSLSSSYYRSADAILLAFDLTDERTFTNLDAWLEDVRLYAQRHVEIMLCGNKVDLEADRVVDYKDAKAYADKHSFQYFETSAKTRINVDKSFTKLTQTVYATKSVSRSHSTRHRRVHPTAAHTWCHLCVSFVQTRLPAEECRRGQPATGNALGEQRCCQWRRGRLRLLIAGTLFVFSFCDHNASQGILFEMEE